MSRSASVRPRYSSREHLRHRSHHETERVDIRDQVAAVRIDLDHARDGALLRGGAVDRGGGAGGRGDAGMRRSSTRRPGASRKFLDQRPVGHVLAVARELAKYSRHARSMDSGSDRNRSYIASTYASLPAASGVAVSIGFGCVMSPVGPGNGRDPTTVRTGGALVCGLEPSRGHNGPVRPKNRRPAAAATDRSLTARRRCNRTDAAARSDRRAAAVRRPKPRRASTCYATGRPRPLGARQAARGR